MLAVRWAEIVDYVCDAVPGGNPWVTILGMGLVLVLTVWTIIEMHDSLQPTGSSPSARTFPRRFASIPSDASTRSCPLTTEPRPRASASRPSTVRWASCGSPAGRTGCRRLPAPARCGTGRRRRGRSSSPGATCCSPARRADRHKLGRNPQGHRPVQIGRNKGVEAEAPRLQERRIAYAHDGASRRLTIIHCLSISLSSEQLRP